MPGKKSTVEPTVKQLLIKWSQTGKDYVADLSWSPDGKLIARSDAGGNVSILDASTGGCLKEWHAHELGALKARWSAHGKHLASCGQDGTARVYDLKDWSTTSVCRYGSGWVEHLAWHGRQEMFLAASGKELKLWAADGKLIQEFAKHKSTIADVTWNPAAPDLFATSSYGGVRLWNLKHPSPKRLLEWKGSILNITYSPNGKVLAAGCQDGAAHVWLLPSAQDLFMNGYPTKVRELSWDAGSRFLATGGGPEVIIWDFSGKGPSGSEPIVFPGHESFISVLSFAPHGLRLASGGLDGQIFIWDVGDPGNVLLSSDGDSDVSFLCWSPDGKQLAAGFASGVTTICRLE
jgi:WD40 repeat protein